LFYYLINAGSRILTLHVDHLPEWTSYTNNVVDRATNE